MKVAKYIFTVFSSIAVLAACQEEPESSSSEDTPTDEELSSVEESETKETEEESAENGETTSSTEDTDQSEEETSETGDTTETEETSGTEDSPDINDEQLNDVIDKSEEIESYEALVDLEATVDETEAEELQADVRFIEGNPPSLHLTSYGEDRTIVTDGDFYFYTGEEWVNATESLSVDGLFFVTYDNTVESIASVADSLEAEDNGNTTIYTYEGSNMDVFRTFENLYQVSFGTVDTSDVDSTLSIEVDNEDDLISSIDYTAEGEDSEGPFTLDGYTEFTSFNEIDEIHAPEEVREQ